MASRASRLLQLLETLRGHRRPVSAAVLADALQVSPRTLYRDIATLREQGAQIEGEAWLGYLLRPGFTLPPLMFGEEEIEALVLGAQWVAQQADPELALAARHALDRIRATLPAHLRLAVDTSGLLVPPVAAAPPEPWLPALRRAIRNERKVQIDYRDAKGAVSQRTVWPFAMGFFQASRVLAAWCELRQEFRHFRADRVADLRDMGEAYPVRRHVLIQRWHAARTTSPQAATPLPPSAARRGTHPVAGPSPLHGSPGTEGPPSLPSC